ncbi:hypothetical protein ASD11_15935 [Aeromicrobium sp. Root495]|uniref:endonuclease/exonuclease/phosphatase family protein n=1 Tax=Aeromicrobium sp. Root495 TaxID=1736550 RepID=UPI0006F30B41|nr:endonuclease/exonuclease/phosphatase family protein [Aeromicrobium sp. Root495]KQY55971.1 hypothetical protein ASD11_15935 [Aeromicrobium sp. Root495]
MNVSGVTGRRSIFAALLAGVLVTGLLAASPAEAAEYGIKTAPSSFQVASKSPTRMTFSWKRPISKGVQRVKYTVTIAGNRDMNRDANYEVKTSYGYTRTSTRTTTRDKSPIFGINQPTLYGYGARIWVNVVTSTLGPKKYRKADPQKASNRYSAGLQPANPKDPASDLKVTPTCKGFTARWNSMPAGARGMKVEVTDLKTLAKQSFVGYEPARSLAVSSLPSSTTYSVRAQATSVKQRSGWTAAQTITTTTCASDVVRVGSYNALVWREGKAAAWGTRAPLVAAGITSANLDLVGLQETSASSGPSGPQLDTLMSKLGRSTWRVADDTLGGVHLIYNKDRLSTVGASQTDDRLDGVAVAQAFRAGPREPAFVAVSLHSTAGLKSQVVMAKGLAESVKTAEKLPADTPVVFVGDVLLRDKEETRTVVRAELSKTMSDAEYYKPGRALDLYNSRNALIRCPRPISGIKVDGIFSSDAVAVTSWSMPKYGFSSGCFRGVFPSDHNLLTANVWLGR